MALHQCNRIIGMHIAFLTPEYPHPDVRHSAGIGTSIKNMATGLTAAGHRVTVFVYSQSHTKVLNSEGIELHLIAHKTYRFGGWLRYRKLVNTYLNTVIAQSDISVIEAPDWTGITAFMQFKIPVVIRLHGSDTYFCDLEGRPQKKKNFFFEKMALRGATAIASVSAFTAERTLSLFGLSTTFTVLPNPIDTSKFQPGTAAVIAGSILNFGSVIRKKGVLALAKAFDQMARSSELPQLTFLGNDVKDSQTGKSTRSLILASIDPRFHSRVHFIDAVPYDQVISHIEKAAVICLPSFAEAFPMTWLEAMAMEKGLVTSDIGWAKELMIDGETGLMVDPNEPKALAAALEHLLEYPEQAKTMGKAARAHLMAHFAMEALTARNISFYNQVLKK